MGTSRCCPTSNILVNQTVQTSFTPVINTIKTSYSTISNLATISPTKTFKVSTRNLITVYLDETSASSILSSTTTYFTAVAASSEDNSIGLNGSKASILAVLFSCLFFFGIGFLAWFLRRKKKIANSKNDHRDSFGQRYKNNSTMIKTMQALNLYSTRNNEDQNSRNQPTNRNSELPQGFQLSIGRSKKRDPPSLPESIVNKNENLPPHSKPIATSNETNDTVITIPFHTPLTSFPVYNPETVVPNCLAIADHEPVEISETAIVIGDKLLVTTYYTDGWALGYNMRTQKSGYFPWRSCAGIPVEISGCESESLKVTPESNTDSEITENPQNSTDVRENAPKPSQQASIIVRKSLLSMIPEND
ncbi:hypothetical protein HK096_010322 [Nowakowskiella sp. JEL0078]|nr:hypothetical protein HK096_010322 [Nowakowskiella sp. JEL0078]